MQSKRTQIIAFGETLFPYLQVNADGLFCQVPSEYNANQRYSNVKHSSLTVSKFWHISQQ